MYKLWIPWDEKMHVRALAREYAEAADAVDLERMKNVATGMALRFYELLSQEEAEELRRRNAERRLSLRVGQTVMKGSKEAEVPMSYSGRTSSQDDSFTVLLKRFNGQWVVTGYRTMTLGPFGGEITTE